MPPLDDRPAPETAPPVPLLLSLESDRAVIRPGETMVLTLNAWRATEEPIEGMPLTLDLPAELQPAQGDVDLQWRLPELTNEEIFAQKIEVRLIGGALPFETAVAEVVLHTAATAQFSAHRAALVVGIEARAAAPPVAPIVEGALREKGLVLRGRYGDVTLLVEAESAEVETNFAYRDGYRWGEGAAAPVPAAQSPLTTTGAPTVTVVVSAATALSATNNLLYMPLIRGNEATVAAQAGNATTAETPDETPAFALVDETLIEDNGVSFVRQWSLNADYQGRARERFAKRIHLLVDAKWLIERGFDPTRLTLYTRTDAKQPWEEVPSTRYDPEQQVFHAKTSHFSEYGLGLSQGVVGEVLPDVSNFSTDLFTGAATLNYRLDTPAGSGGMAPQLSLDYSSATVDSQRWDNNKNQSNGYRIQAGLAGIGWNLSALNHIAFIDEGTDAFSTTDNRYSLILNGTSTTFLDGQPVTESFDKITKSLTNAVDPTDFRVKVTGTGSWTVTTRDGTRHIFGGAPVHYSNSSTTSNQGIILNNIGTFDTYRGVNKWYLSKSVDSNGNYIEYSYLSDTRETNCSTNNKYRGAGGWYYRAMRPNTISWGGNEQTGAGHKMQATFTYENRTDTGIWQRDNVCTQSMYSTVRLKKVNVQVYSESAWRALREYELSYLYSAGHYQHSWLNTIKHYGFTGSGTRTSNPLQTYTFDYTVGAIHSEVYMLTANNGWGGKVTYGYAAPATWRCEIDNTTNCDPVAYRRQVNSKYVYDGVNGTGNWTRTVYGYGEGLYRRYKNDPVDFLGYPTAWSVTYALNSNSTEAKVTEHWFYRNNGYTARGDIANNPDPRLGRSDYERVLQPGTSGCPSGQIVGTRCKMAETDAVYTALTGSGTNWNATSSYTARPRWVRQDAVVNWVNGAALAQVFSYDAAKQNNTQFGNVTKVQERDGSTGGALQRWTETDYFPNTSAHIVSRPARVRVYDASNVCQSETRTTYDNNGSAYNVAPTKGLPSRLQQALSSCSSSAAIADTETTWHIQQLSYDAYGNQTQVKSFGHAASGWPDSIMNTTYDSTYRLFPIRRYSTVGSVTLDETAFYYGVNKGGSDPAITDAKAHWGALAEWCGVNEVCTRTAYDDYGRVSLQWEGLTTNAGWNGTPTTTRSYKMYGEVVSGAALTRNVITEWRMPRCYGNFSRKVYNGLGQLIQVQGPQQNWTANTDGCNPGVNAAEVDLNYAYDALGNQSRAGVPVATSVAWNNRAPNWGAYTLTAYDVLGRPKTVTSPNGAVQSYGYAGRAMSIILVGRNGDPNKMVKWQELDALGRPKYVRTYAHNGSQWVIDGQVTLTHNVLDNLTDVTHPNSIATTTMNYDLAGRKTSMTDPDLGSWSYIYNRQHQLVRQKDSRDKNICLYYDGFDRLAGKRFPSNTTCPTTGSYAVSYVYDQNHGSSLDGVTNRSRGQLTSVSNAGYSKSLFYNDKGLLRKETVTISGAATYSTLYGYDAYLRPNTTTYPDGEVVTQQYNSMGLPAKLTSSSAGDLVDGTVNVAAFSDAVSYDEAGRLTAMRFPAGGDLWRTHYYHGWTATNTTYPGSGDGRLDEIRVGISAGSSSRLLLVHDYDSFGNLKRLAENGTNHSFTYDVQNRLTAGYGQSYSYDTAGRITNYEGAAQTVNNSFPGHAIKKTGYSYDANGNLLTRAGGQSLTWNHENRLSAISGGGLPTESYLYDDNGIRVKKFSNGVATYYVNGFYEISGSTVTKYYYPSTSSGQASTVSASPCAKAAPSPTCTVTI